MWTNTNLSGDSWGRYGTESDSIVQLLGDHGWLGKMLSIFGDTHAMAMDSGGGNPYGGFPLFLTPPFDSPLDAGPNFDLGRLGSATNGTRGQWGTVTITDPGPWIKVGLKGWYWS